MTAPEDAVFLVLCTVPEPEARALADQLLEERRIACANLLGPIESRYRWQGKLEVANEVLLLMKTRSAMLAGLRDRIAELHSYDVPEVLEFRAESGLPPYLEWVVGSCSTET